MWHRLNHLMAPARDGTIRLAAIAILAITLPGRAAEGPESVDPVTEDRHKFGVQLGGGYGRISTDAGSGVFGGTSSTPDDFTVGFAVSADYSYRKDEKVAVDAFLNGWVGALDGDMGNEDWSFGIIGGGFRWYPMGNDLFLRGGFGGGGVNAMLPDAPEGTTSEFSDFGFGVLATVGYDMSVAADFTAGPRVELVALDVGDGVNAVSVNALFAFAW
ncbi:MAG: hypothetical protein DHS20C21_17010 [Gemmatimonadota bacterium]|nr:MAG: hypothetical protein DHS20C21_17010 [Gemmatimonadota bacterium]